MKKYKDLSQGTKVFLSWKIHMPMVTKPAYKDYFGIAIEPLAIQKPEITTHLSFNRTTTKPNKRKNEKSCSVKPHKTNKTNP